MSVISDTLRALAAATLAHPEAILFVAFGTVSSVSGAVLLLQDRRHLRLAGLAALVFPMAFLGTTSGLLSALFAASFISLVAWVIGLAVLARLGVIEGASATHALALGLGYGAIGFVALGLGVVGLLNAVAIAAALGTAGLLAVFDLKRTSPVSIGSWLEKPRSVLPLTVVVLVWFGLLPYVMAPELMYDAVYYHLALAKEFLEQQSVAQIPNQFQSNFPILPQLTYATATALSAELDAGKIVHLFIGLAVALSLYALAAHSGGGVIAGLTAVLIWFGAPLVLWEMSTSYVDLFSVLFAVLSVLATVMWADTRRTSYALVVAALIALGLGVKPSAAFHGVAIAIALLLLIRTRRELMAWIGAAVLALVVAAPWYIRSYLLTGNPVFPFLNGIFRSPQWEPVNENFNFETFGVGSSALDLLQLPLRLVLETSRFGEMPNGALGVLPLLGGLGLIAAAIAGDRRLRFVAVSCVVGTVLWFLSAQYGRYLLPILALEAAVVAVFLARLAARARVGHVVLSLALAGIVGVSFVRYVSMLGNVPGTVPWPVALGKQAPEAYLSQALRHYSAYRWLAEHAPSSAKVLGVGLSEWPVAYSEPNVYIAHVTQIGRQILLAPSAEDARARFRSASFDYVIIDHFPRPTPWQSGYAFNVASTIDANSLRLVYGNNYVYIYAASPPELPEHETLQDVELHRLSAADAPWKRFGALPEASEQCTGAHINDHGGYAQAFDARPDTLHLFEVALRPLGTGASGKLQVNWLRQDGSLTTSIEIYPISEQQETITMASTSPADARQGVVYLSGYGGVDVCVERASALTRR